jgi:hypothetical protein
MRRFRTDARCASERQVLRCAQNDNQKAKARTIQGSFPFASLEGQDDGEKLATARATARATATATAKTNTGILRCAQDDGSSGTVGIAQAKAPAIAGALWFA